MGYYIQGPNLGKADYLLATHPDFKEVTKDEAEIFQCEGKVGVVVVVNNGPFEAAAFAFSDQEFEEFTEASDPRRKRFLTGPLDLVKELSGYNR
jgi:hypothetical protein